MISTVPPGRGLYIATQMRLYGVHQVALERLSRCSGEQCSIGFQPVSGRTPRHPRKAVSFGTRAWKAFTPVNEDTGWKLMLQRNSPM
jgi:hypothetical protein